MVNLCMIGFVVALSWQLAFSATCSVTTYDDTTLVGNHYPICSPLEFSHYPPVGGAHYNVWAAYQEYSQSLLPGFWMHNLEHGGLVFLYHCPNGCSEEVMTLRRWMQTIPEESPTCAGVDRRAILAPDSLMSTRFAVIAWGHSLASDCLDSLSVANFIKLHFRNAPEDICSSGPDPITQNLCADSPILTKKMELFRFAPRANHFQSLHEKIRQAYGVKASAPSYSKRF